MFYVKMISSNMLPNLHYIKELRIRLGLTQRNLAGYAGISTSMVNQIESGRCQPSYETARKIFEVLNSLEGQSSIKAGDICNRTLMFVKKNDTLHDAIDMMRKHSISQLPVFHDSRVVGVVSEDLLARIMIEKDQKDIRRMTVSAIMEPPPPIVDISTPAKALIPLVRFSKCVLVSEKGHVVGVITITDTLKIVE
jgi:predicted transcriptional regulator